MCHTGNILPLLITFCIAIVSCAGKSTDGDGGGSPASTGEIAAHGISFSLEIPDAPTGSSSYGGNLFSAAGKSNDPQVTHAAVSMIDGDGKTVFTRKILRVTNAGGKYLTEPVALLVGDYQLTELIALDSGKKACFAAPTSNHGGPAGSPLPMGFSLRRDTAQSQSVSLIAADPANTTPAYLQSLGYASLDVTFRETFHFYLDIQAYADSGIAPIPSKVTITPSDTNTAVQFDLEARISIINLELTGTMTAATSFAIKIESPANPSLYPSIEKTMTLPQIRYLTTPIAICLGSPTVLPMAQVVNNTGFGINSVKVGEFVFSDNLACGDGCSTDFTENMPATAYILYIKVKSTDSFLTVGSLGALDRNRTYAINLRTDAGGKTLFADLYTRTDTSPSFNNDATKRLVRTISATLPGGESGSPSGSFMMQVVNNTGSGIDGVKVGEYDFSDSIFCGDGCSTGFTENMPSKEYAVSVRLSSFDPWTTVGTIGPLPSGKTYALNLRISGTVLLAELWTRTSTAQKFNLDSTKRYENISISCTLPQRTYADVTNVSNEGIYKVYIGPVEFTKNLTVCGSGCGTDFQRIPSGANSIRLMRTSVSDVEVIGTSDAFSAGNYYSVSITVQGTKRCATLYKVGNPSVPNGGGNRGLTLIGTICQP